MDILIGLTNLPQILITWCVYFGAGLLFLAIGLWAKRRSFSVKKFLTGSFPFNLLSSRSVRMDAKVYVIGKLTDFFWGAPGALLSAVLPLAVADALGDIAPTLRLGSGPIVLTMTGIALFLTMELADFAFHYCEHKVPAMWELHKVHHSAESLNPLTSKRGHPVSIALIGVVRAFFFCVPAGAAMHFAGLSLVEVVVARELVAKTCTILTLDPLRHSPYPVSFGWLDRLFISPHMHQIHHSSLEPHWDKNFGTNLSLYDWVFRTAYKPIKNEPIELGLYGYSAAELSKYHTMYGTYVTPLMKAWGKIASARNAANGRSSGPSKDASIAA
jgi:sterol desaturase/sphingolipid hydroxylase (fatty acid hydroxylase superfamily)